MNKPIWLFVFILLFLSGCGQPMKGELKNVGLLVPETINEQVWGTKGYAGVLSIQSSFGIDVFYKEHMISEEVVRKAVKEFNERGVNLIFGHGDEYAQYFNNMSLGENTVLTSTVQHVDQLYELVAKEYNEGKLQGGNLFYDFKDGVISMGEFSPLVDVSYQEKLKESIEIYKESGKLPNQDF